MTRSLKALNILQTRDIHILMTGAGAPGAPGILKCLAREPQFRVTAADAAEQVSGRYLSDTFIQIPSAADPVFAERLLELCRTHQIDVILPLVTRELLPLAKHHDLFREAGVRIPLSPAASLEIANNKARLYEFLEWRGIEVPDYRVVESAPQFMQAARELGYPGKTICFKPAVSNGSRGFRIIDGNMDERDLLFNQKPTAAYTRLEEAERILTGGTIPELLVSEYLPGEEYSVDCLANRGEAVLILPRLRKRMVNGITVEGEFIKEEAIIDYCSRIIHELKLHGNIGIQVKKSDQGKFLILEINPRVQGGISTALGAGVNLPVLAIWQEIGLPAQPEDLVVKWGTRFIRYWEDVFF